MGTPGRAAELVTEPTGEPLRNHVMWPLATSAATLYALTSGMYGAVVVPPHEYLEERTPNPTWGEYGEMLATVMLCRPQS